MTKTHLAMKERVAKRRKTNKGKIRILITIKHHLDTVTHTDSHKASTVMFAMYQNMHYTVTKLYVSTLPR